jgi:uncharacterized protein with GYD domain
MSTFIMTTRLAPTAARSPATLGVLERKVMTAVHDACPEARWQASFALAGPYDYLDVFDAPDTETAVRVATLIRTLGHAQTELWPAFEWSEFKELIGDLPERTAAAGTSPRKAMKENADMTLQGRLFPSDANAAEPVALEEVAAILDDGDDAAIAEILALRPTREEFATAVAWAEGEDEILGRTVGPLHGKARAIYDILTAGDDWMEQAATR